MRNERMNIEHGHAHAGSRSYGEILPKQELNVLMCESVNVFGL